jgi:hypothetical protein
VPQAKDVSFTTVDYVSASATAPAPSHVTTPLLRVLMGGRQASRHIPSRNRLSGDDAEYERRVPTLSRGIKFGLLFVAPFWAAVALLLWWLL